MTEYAEYYVFIPCGFPNNIIKADLVFVNTVDMFHMTKDIELSPKFMSIEAKDNWLTPENINKLNDKLLAFIDKTGKDGHELSNMIVKLMNVPHTDGKGFSMGEIVLDVLGKSDSKNNISMMANKEFPITEVLSDIFGTDSFKYDLPEDMRIFDKKEYFDEITCTDKKSTAKVINLADYRK